jgi:ring-1,2-phenylacetyl-CoA epoxidase subunit PaaC
MRGDDLVAYSVALGDDALVLGQRLCEWVSRLPTLEEELALGNVALDHIGRARMFYGYAVEREVTLGHARRSEDDLAFSRDCREFTNLLINELPRGDFAFTLVRQFLIDAFNVPFMEGLAASAEPALAQIGAKAFKESTYHLRRSRDWIPRLGDGAPEAHTRTQCAIDALWGYTRELFEPSAVELRLAPQRLVPDRSALEAQWRGTIETTFAEATLTVPQTTSSRRGGRDGLHTEHLGYLIAEMQFLQRAYPGRRW